MVLLVIINFWFYLILFNKMCFTLVLNIIENVSSIWKAFKNEKNIFFFKLDSSVVIGFRSNLKRKKLSGTVFADQTNHSKLLGT